MQILTNWNSVAAPAPASAFLSAPAEERDEWVTNQRTRSPSTALLHSIKGLQSRTTKTEAKYSKVKKLLLRLLESYWTHPRENPMVQLDKIQEKTPIHKQTQMNSVVQMPKLRQESNFPLFFLKGGQYRRQFSQRAKLHKEQGWPDSHTATRRTLTWNGTASVRIPVSLSPSKTRGAFTFQTWKWKQQHQIHCLPRTQTTHSMGWPCISRWKKALRLSIRSTSRAAPWTAQCI